MQTVEWAQDLDIALVRLFRSNNQPKKVEQDLRAIKDGTSELLKRRQIRSIGMRSYFAKYHLI